MIGEVPEMGAIFFAIEGAAMQRVNQFPLYQLGVHMQRLRGLQSGEPFAPLVIALSQAQNALGVFVAIPEHAKDLPRSAGQAGVLRAVVLAMLNQASVELDSPKQALLVEQVERFEVALADELRRLPTYTVQQVRTYSSNDLLQRAENQFPEGIREKLAKRSEVLEDFREAAKCLLFERFTASGFHAVRALEYYARRYHAMITGKSLDPEKPLNWQVVINELQAHLDTEKKSKRPDINLLELIAVTLRPIKDIRNLVAHGSERMLTQDEAIEVFDIVGRSISWIVQDGDRRKPGFI